MIFCFGSLPIADVVVGGGVFSVEKQKRKKTLRSHETMRLVAECLYAGEFTIYARVQFDKLVFFD